MNPKTVEQLVEEALDAFNDPQQSVADHVRRAIRVATKRNDYVALLRLLPETFDLTVGSKIDHPGYRDARENLAALIGREEAKKQAITAFMRFERDRSSGDGMTHGSNIGQIEALRRQVVDAAAGFETVPQNLTPIDTYFVAERYDKARAELVPVANLYDNIIERVRQAVFDIVVDIERQMEAGQRRPGVFERGRQYVETSLAERAPEALEKFRAAEAALEEGSPEDLAHALTSCRRMIKALADALYPATDETILGADGRERAMTDEAYRNRLVQFASERIDSGTHRDFAKETMRSLGARLQRLNELSSKAVHDEVSRTEAETCIMWTYLTAADFLRLADGTSPRLAEDDDGPEGVSAKS